MKSSVNTSRWKLRHNRSKAAFSQYRGRNSIVTGTSLWIYWLLRALSLLLTLSSLQSDTHFPLCQFICFPSQSMNQLVSKSVCQCNCLPIYDPEVLREGMRRAIDFSFIQSASVQGLKISRKRIHFIKSDLDHNLDFVRIQESEKLWQTGGKLRNRRTEWHEEHTGENMTN